MAAPDEKANRRSGYRLLSLALVVAVGLLVLPVLRRSPADVAVIYRFGSEGRKISGARIEYLYVADSESAPANADLSLAWEFGGGAPAEKEHRAHLTPGRYAVALRLRFDDGSWKSADTGIEVPAGGKARILVDVLAVLAAQPTPASHRAPAEPVSPADGPAIPRP